MRRGASILFTFLLVALAAAAYAAPAHVGPLDGKAAPSLPAIAMPGDVVTEKLASTAFPATLEQMGDYPSAILEWQRVAYQSDGADRLNALLHTATLQARISQTTAATNTYQTVLREYPTATQTPEILYHLAQITSGAAYTNVLTTLKTSYFKTDFAQAALLQNVWQQAKIGPISQTYGLPEAETLKKRLAAEHLINVNKGAMAGALGVIPGAGQIYLHQAGQGLAMFVMWALFLLAFLSACRHRHYAYAFVFVVPAMALWLSSPATAIDLAKQQAAQRRITNLAKWTDLAPKLPTQAAAPAAPTLTETLTQPQ